MLGALARAAPAGFLEREAVLFQPPARDDLDRTSRALHVAGLSLMSAGLYPALSIAHERFYELTSAPKQFRGLRDLTIRLATPAELHGLLSEVLGSNAEPVLVDVPVAAMPNPFRQMRESPLPQARKDTQPA